MNDVLAQFHRVYIILLVEYILLGVACSLYVTYQLLA